MPDKYQQRLYKQRLIRQGIVCIACEVKIEHSEIDNTSLIKIDTNLPYRVANLTMRHKTCNIILEQRRKIAELENRADTFEDHAELMVKLFRQQDLCHNCGSQFDSESTWLDDLIIINKEGKQYWAHKVCPT